MEHSAIFLFVKQYSLFLLCSIWGINPYGIIIRKNQERIFPVPQSDKREELAYRGHGKKYFLKVRFPSAERLLNLTQ